MNPLIWFPALCSLVSIVCATLTIHYYRRTRQIERRFNYDV